MTLRDLTDMSLGNLWRNKPRALLTIAGVVIAIATFVAMVSFAAGNHRFVTEGFTQLGLFTRMDVFPQLGNPASDSTGVAQLDDDAVGRLERIPGVKLAYPFVNIDVKAALADTSVATSARALSRNEVRTPLFTTLLNGANFSADDANEAIVREKFLDMVGIDHPDSLIGRRLIVSTKAASIDSAVINAFGEVDDVIPRLVGTVRFDSLSYPEYVRRIAQRELADKARLFFDGLMNRQITVADTLVVVAVAPEVESRRLRTAPIFVTERTARKLTSAGINIGDDPTALFAAMRSGELFQTVGEENSQSYPRITLELEPIASASAVKDSVEAMGFRAFSFAEQFEEIQRFFVYYYLGMSVVGLIALITASLGIVNTMVMSITERRREIGVMKALGAGEREIRMVFLAESATIGAIGSAMGIFLGWVGTRIVAAIAKIIMEREEMPVFDPFALPFWLIVLSLAFGVLVSLLAGAYPSGRAARVDPVEALRSE
jgi:ABC-type lipoprotein release transport system permease subunit